MSNYVKCLVWDLDDTLWEGTLLAGDRVRVREGVPEILQTLKERGILCSIASRNEEGATRAVLREFELETFFVAPQMNFNPKVDNLIAIAETLNIAVDSLAFIDDSPFEREAVAYSLPEVLVLEAARYEDILGMAAFNPPTQTEASRKRAAYYQAEGRRKVAEKAHGGTRLDFLKSCQMSLTLRAAEGADTARVVELSERTNQFNASGLLYTAAEVQALIEDPRGRVFMAELSDRFGDYGNVGAMTLRLGREEGLVESMMVSCRAAGRGVAAALLILAMRTVVENGLQRLQIAYRATARNRQLGILYSMMGFNMRAGEEEGLSLWSYDPGQQPIPEMPEWLSLSTSLDALVR